MRWWRGGAFESRMTRMKAKGTKGVFRGFRPFSWGSCFRAPSFALRPRPGGGFRWPHLSNQVPAICHSLFAHKKSEGHPPLANTLHASRSTLHASRFTFHASRLTFHVPRSTPHAPCFTLHASRFTPHASRLTSHAPRLLSDRRHLAGSSVSRTGSPTTPPTLRSPHHSCTRLEKRGPWG